MYMPEPVYRACHTLAGSSKMAEARHGIRLAEPLNHWLRKSFDSGVGLTASDLALLGDCMGAIETVSRNLDEQTGFFVVHGTLLQRIAQAEAQLDQRIAAAQTGTQARGADAADAGRDRSAPAAVRRLQPAAAPAS